MEVISVDPIPFKHEQLEADLRRMIAERAVGDRLPGENALARDFGCNFLTVRRALKRLVDEGLVVRVSGRGTFVTGGGVGAAPEWGASAPVKAGSAVKVGLLAWTSGSGFCQRLIEAAGMVAPDLDVELRQVWIGDFEKDAMAAAASLARGGCGVLLIPWFPLGQREEFRRFREGSPVPVCAPNPIGVGGQVAGDPQPALLAALIRYLRELGGRRFALVGPDAPEDAFLQRFVTNIIFAASREGLDLQCLLVKSSSQAMDTAAERSATLRGDLAVVAYDDEHALRYMAAMRSLGWVAPRDFRIVGRNAIDASQWSDPPLTSLDRDYPALAAGLIGRALALVGVKREPVTEPARLKLIVRKSCGGAGEVSADWAGRYPELEFVTDPSHGR